MKDQTAVVPRTTGDPGAAPLNWWERLVRVESSDPDIVRQGRVFNILMLISTGLVIYVSAVFVISYLLGYLDLSTALIAAAFPLAFVPASLLAIVSAKRGYLRRVVPLYVWANFVGIAIACFIFDGPTSVAWLLFLWTTTVAGTLIAPRYSLLITALVVGYYVLLLGAAQLGLYSAPIALTTEAKIFQIFALVIAMLITTAGLLTYLNMSSLNSTLGNLVVVTQDLERSQQELEQRVEDRTLALQERATQFRAIVGVGQGTTGITDLEELLQAAADLICTNFGVTHVGIYLVDDVHEHLRLRATSAAVPGTEGGAVAPLVPAPNRFERWQNLRLGDPGLLQSVVATARPRLASTPAEFARWQGQADAASGNITPWVEIRSELALPLEAGGRIMGVLDILSAQVEAFDQGAREALSLMANNLEAAIENVLLLGRMQESLIRLEKYEEEDVVRGWRMALARRNQRLDYAYDRLVVRPGLPEDLSQLVEDHPPSRVETLEYAGSHWLMAPLRVQQRLLGTLTFESPRPWTADQRRLAETVVDQLGLALENARLLEDTRLSAQRERARGEIVGRVRGSVQIDAVLRSAVEELGRALQVERARIQLLPPRQETARQEAAQQNGARQDAAAINGAKTGG
ncbi:MAG: GAF domain-containing protein [Anaerolineae bacterium]|nr:GAF domain-containing protein [Anaerolineae bacterium]